MHNLHYSVPLPKLHNKETLVENKTNILKSKLNVFYAQKVLHVLKKVCGHFCVTSKKSYVKLK